MLFSVTRIWFWLLRVAASQEVKLMLY